MNKTRGLYSVYIRECVKTWIMLSFRSPENSLLCVFGQANPAPTADDGIGRFSFDTLPLLLLEFAVIPYKWKVWDKHYTVWC